MLQIWELGLIKLMAKLDGIQVFSLGNILMMMMELS